MAELPVSGPGLPSCRGSAYVFLSASYAHGHGVAHAGVWGRTRRHMAVPFLLGDCSYWATFMTGSVTNTKGFPRNRRFFHKKKKLLADTQV
jgi:hypothetical protein